MRDERPAWTVAGVEGIQDGPVTAADRVDGLDVGVPVQGVEREPVHGAVQAVAVRDLRQGAVLTLIGVALGSGLAFLLSPVLRSQLVGVNPRDPVVFLAVPVLLSAVSLLACYVPARRAAQTHPLSALRQE